MVGAWHLQEEGTGKEMEAGDAQGTSSFCLFVCFDGKVDFIQGNYYNEVAGEQNLPPQNVSLVCRLFPAENNQGPKDSGRNFDLPPNCLKEFR